MDRRYETRLPSDLPVTIVQLDDGDRIVGSLVDISESGICASLPLTIAPGTMVEVKVLEVSLYGEIVYSQPEADSYRTGIYVEQVLLETSNVARIVQCYLDTSKATADADLIEEPQA